MEILTVIFYGTIGLCCVAFTWIASIAFFLNILNWFTDRQWRKQKRCIHIERAARELVNNFHDSSNDYVEKLREELDKQTT